MKKDKSGNYAFIDSQNLNLGVRSQGWQLDFKKFRLYLKNKYQVDKAFLFIGMVPGNEKLYSSLSEYGYKLIFKQTVEYTESGKKTYKGNVDAELVLYAAARVYNDYEKAVIVSGDGDFACLVEYLNEKDKLLQIICPISRYSSLLRGYRNYIQVIGSAQKSLEYKKDQNRRSVETLGLSDHGDINNISKKTTNVNNRLKNTGDLDEER